MLSENIKDFDTSFSLRRNSDSLWSTVSLDQQRSYTLNESNLAASYNGSSLYLQTKDKNYLVLSFFLEPNKKNPINSQAIHNSWTDYLILAEVFTQGAKLFRVEW